MHFRQCRTLGGPQNRGRLHVHHTHTQLQVFGTLDLCAAHRVSGLRFAAEKVQRTLHGVQCNADALSHEKGAVRVAGLPSGDALETHAGHLGISHGGEAHPWKSRIRRGGRSERSRRSLNLPVSAADGSWSR